MRTAKPLDIRLMNATAALLFTLAALGCAWLAVTWVTGWPVFSIEAIRIDNELQRSTATTIRANALPKLHGNFFSIDLEESRQAFQSVPWVRRAAVQRIWPNRLAVRIEEHKVAAYWGESRLVNTYGEVFEANLGDVEEENLPTLQGPEGSAPQLLHLWGPVSEAVRRLGAKVERLSLSERGSWTAELDNGAEIEMGRGDSNEVLNRLERFVATWAQVTASYPGPLEYADLRHHNGYAVRIKGITTQVAPAAAKRN